MKYFKKISLLILVSISCITESGCVSFIPENPDVVKNPQISLQNNEPHYGFVALSAACHGNISLMSMGYDTVDFNLLNELTVDTTYKNLPINCNSTIPQYFLLKLPIGHYVVNSLTIRLTIYDTDYANKFPPLYFKVVPSKVVYIGGFYTEINLPTAQNSNNKYRFSLVNESKNDITWFVQHYPNIPGDRYEVEIANPKKDNS